MLVVQRLLKLFSPAARTALQLLGVVAALRIEQIANLVLLQVWANAPNRCGQLVNGLLAHLCVGRARIFEQDGGIVQRKASVLVKHELGCTHIKLELVQHLFGRGFRLRLFRLKVGINGRRSLESGKVRNFVVFLVLVVIIVVVTAAATFGTFPLFLLAFWRCLFLGCRLCGLRFLGGSRGLGLPHALLVCLCRCFLWPRRLAASSDAT